MKKALEFHDELKIAIDSRAENLETEILPKLKELFKNYHASLLSILTLLLKKGLIKEDPYKHEQKISEISIPPVTQIMENEKAAQLGSRLSFYDTQLEHITQYYIFSVEFLTRKRINLLKKFVDYIQWSSVAEISKNPTTRVLASVLSNIRNGNDPLSISIINTSINQLSTLQKLIGEDLNKVQHFHREAYKFRVRDRIIINSGIYKYAAENSNKDTLSVIKKKFNETMVDEKFIPELITEILEEEFSTESDELKADLLFKLTDNTSKKEKEDTSKPKIKPPSLNMLLNAALTACSASSQLKSLIDKINWNSAIITELTITPLMKVFIRIFKIDTGSKTVFEIDYIDDLTGMKKTEKIEKADFLRNIKILQEELNSQKLKIKVTAITTTEGRENYLIEFIENINTRLKIFTYRAGGIDKYLKKITETTPVSRQIKGFLIEINAIKNIIIKSRKQAQEYKNMKEEYKQFQELGID